MFSGIESEYRDVPTGTTSALPFTLPTEVALIRLDFAAQSIARKFAGDQPAQTHEKPDRRVRLNTHEFRYCARCATYYKIFNQALLPAGQIGSQSQGFDMLAAAGNTRPDDIWSDGTTMWVPNYDQNEYNAKTYAYNLATKRPIP